MRITHRQPSGLSDRLAHAAVATLRLSFDLLSGYTLHTKLGTLDERAILRQQSTVYFLHYIRTSFVW